MALSTVLRLVAFGAILIQAVISSRVVLEPDQQLARERDHWTEGNLAARDARFPLVFAVKHTNPKALEMMLMSVSSPGSPEYRRHMSADQVRELVRPSIHSIRKVHEWLADSGISGDTDCVTTAGQEFIECDVTVAQASSLLEVTIKEYTHTDGLTTLRASDHYSVPEALVPHLDFVGGLHRLTHSSNVKRTVNATRILIAKGNGDLGVTPTTIRQLYGLSADDVGAGEEDKNIQAVAQFLDQHYKASDLKSFMEKHATGFKHMSEVAKEIGPNTGLHAGIEASLDIEYIMAIGANIPTWFWSTGGKHEGQEPFLLWIQAVANSSTMPNVISVSYGDDEDTLSAVYMQRINQEFQKLGVRGVSILFASGDDGAGCHKQVFRPNFPATSPYVTSVGGTSMSEEKEIGVSFSSGGFSNVFATASYQATDVKHYLATSQHLPEERLFNKSGRGYPDVSALAVSFEVVSNGFTVPASGTSCASPTFAGVVSLVNDQLINAHSKPALGFLNPFLYSRGFAGLTDIEHGCNEGCSGSGFCAQVGWDPITGLGTPTYEKLLAEALKA